jgi:hypothetical protein
MVPWQAKKRKIYTRQTLANLLNIAGESKEKSNKENDRHLL